LGTLLSGAHLITDGMLQAAAEWYDVYLEYCLFLFIKSYQNLGL
jgi:hypothetical protein